MTPEEQRDEWISAVELRSLRRVETMAMVWLHEHYATLSDMVSSFPVLGSSETPVGRNLMESICILADNAILWQRSENHSDEGLLSEEAVKFGAVMASSHCWLC